MIYIKLTLSLAVADFYMKKLMNGIVFITLLISNVCAVAHPFKEKIQFRIEKSIWLGWIDAKEITRKLSSGRSGIVVVTDASVRPAIYGEVHKVARRSDQDRGHYKTRLSSIAILIPDLLGIV